MKEPQKPKKEADLYIGTQQMGQIVFCFPMIPPVLLMQKEKKKILKYLIVYIWKSCHFYIFRDENKIKKEWPFKEYYSNFYGFRDVSVCVYIGGTSKSKTLL